MADRRSLKSNQSVTLIKSAQLRGLLRESPGECIVVDARLAREYRRAHIPGAIPVFWEEWCDPPPVVENAIIRRPGYWGLLDAALSNGGAPRLDAAGFHSDRLTVVYADGPASRGREGRIAWMLLYLGARKVALLDRGWRGWVETGGKTETKSAPPKHGRFTVLPRPERRVRLADLKQSYVARNFPLGIDTRTRHEFAGVTYDYMPRCGRLPSSVLLPYNNIFDDAGAYVDKRRFLERLPPEARSAGNLFAYCEVGVRAATVALLYEIYLGRILPLFDGSMMEWGLARELPLGTYERDKKRKSAALAALEGKAMQEAGRK